MASIFLPAFGDKSRIPAEYERIATKHGVPPAIFYAVALAESGYTKGGIYNPWPWTLNIEGNSQRFETLVHARTRLLHVVSEGKHVDIGIMQVNSYWHRHRVSRLSDILDPYVNLNIAAEILVEQRQRSDGWWQAVGRYHAPGNDNASLARAERYRTRVKALHEKYLGRII